MMTMNGHQHNNGARFEPQIMYVFLFFYCLFFPFTNFLHLDACTGTTTTNDPHITHNYPHDNVCFSFFYGLFSHLLMIFYFTGTTITMNGSHRTHSLSGQLPCHTMATTISMRSLQLPLPLPVHQHVDNDSINTHITTRDRHHVNHCHHRRQRIHPHNISEASPSYTTVYRGYCVGYL